MHEGLWEENKSSWKGAKRRDESARKREKSAEAFFPLQWLTLFFFFSLFSSVVFSSVSPSPCNSRRGGRSAATATATPTASSSSRRERRWPVSLNPERGTERKSHWSTCFPQLFFPFLSALCLCSLISSCLYLHAYTSRREGNAKQGKVKKRKEGRTRGETA